MDYLDIFMMEWRKMFPPNTLKVRGRLIGGIDWIGMKCNSSCSIIFNPV
jgi:hypothetical protein